MSTLERAIAIAAAAHQGVVDKQGQPYVLHPLRVMLGVNDPTARIVAVLHDVVEDTAVTLDEIQAEGFSAEVVRALSLMTHDSSTSYADYVVACLDNDIARQVKLADLKDNMSLARFLLRQGTLDRDMRRVQRYLLSYQLLTHALSVEEYRRAMVTCESSV